tara:strand:- start:70096 stop:70296 length:201 start_codon:yes stop_codon:yes gene_type:complete
MAYYIAKVKVLITDQNGKEKKVVEQYLVNGVSVTDVEAKVHTEFRNGVVDFEVSSVTDTKIIKVID